MKLFRHKNFMGLIYSVLVAIPLLSILSRSAYVSLNKNAYQSYSGTTTQTTATPKYQTNEINDYNDFVDGNYYELYWNTTFNWGPEYTSLTNQINLLNDTGYNVLEIISYTNDYSPNVSTGISFSKIITNNGKVDFLTLVNNWQNPSQNNFRSINILSGDDKNDDPNAEIYLTSVVYGSSANFNNVVLVKCIDITQFKQSGAQELEDYFNSTYFRKVDLMQEYTITTTESSTLDNVFEYSIQSFVKDNDFGKLNFFQWFTAMFMNGNNNALYIGFINWYMNYILLVSCAYILFLVLMWFINFSRRILERGMNYDW